MAVRQIVLYLENEETLRKKSQPVERVTRRVRKLVQDLKDTLNDHANGIGLAAPQIDVHSRVVVVRLGSGQDDEGNEREPDPPIALIDPRILEAGDEKRDFDGCLSFPGLYGETVRPHTLRVTGLDEAGYPFDRFFTDLDAVVVHHEIDHLDGVLFIDHIESIEDLYQVSVDGTGKWVRVPVSADVVRLDARRRDDG
ncbi:MAG: peptide deformylase [Anaerolineae bacterium]|nr:peptide deformylase [Anaerolineae bacterium]